MRRVPVLVICAFLLTMPGSAVAAAPRFTVTYTGSGMNRTHYFALSPNPGGAPDHDYATDEEGERWSVRFQQPVVTTGCAQGCTLTGGGGTTAVRARIDHVHVDGLYRQLNASAHCTLLAGTAPPQTAGASLRYTISDGTLTLTLGDPVSGAIGALPPQCPGPPDPIDGLLDNYLGPGFSFAAGWGPDRWFQSRAVSLPIAALRASRRVTVKLGLTSAGTPPRGCATTKSWQHCRTSGSWSGTVTLTRRPSRLRRSQ